MFSSAGRARPGIAPFGFKAFGLFTFFLITFVGERSFTPSFLMGDAAKCYAVTQTYKIAILSYINVFLTRKD
jgi:hypothetical protein